MSREHAQQLEFDGDYERAQKAYEEAITTKTPEDDSHNAVCRAGD